MLFPRLSSQPPTGVGLRLNYDSQQLTDYRIGCVGTALKLYNQMGEKIYCEACSLLLKHGMASLIRSVHLSCVV